MLEGVVEDKAAAFLPATWSFAGNAYMTALLESARDLYPQVTREPGIRGSTMRAQPRAWCQHAEDNITTTAQGEPSSISAITLQYANCFRKHRRIVFLNSSIREKR